MYICVNKKFFFFQLIVHSHAHSEIIQLGAHANVEKYMYNKYILAYISSKMFLKTKPKFCSETERNSLKYKTFWFGSKIKEAIKPQVKFNGKHLGTLNPLLSIPSPLLPSEEQLKGLFWPQEHERGGGEAHMRRPAKQYTDRHFGLCVRASICCVGQVK